MTEGDPPTRRFGIVHRPRRTVRLRLTLLYGGVVLASGAVLLAITFLLGDNSQIQIFGKVTRGSASKSITSGSLPNLTIPPSPSGVIYRITGPTGGLAHGSLSGSGQFSASEVEFAARTASSSELHNLLLFSAMALGIVSILGVILGWLVSGRMLLPIRTMTETTQHISEENLHERLGLSGPVGDELKDLGDTIDGLLTRLETAFDAQGRFVQNASHELRTPITMMRTSLDVATGKPGGVSEEVASLASKLAEGLDLAERLLESFLLLARVQQGELAGRTIVDLAAIAQSSLDRHDELARRIGIDYRADLTPVLVVGSGTLLERVVDNLVDNAIRHNESGGWLSLRTEHTDRDARVIVESSGPLLDQEAVQRLGEPFQRLGAARVANDGGIGLGLSIVTAISRAHGGSLTLEARQQGGLRAIVELPLAATPPAART